MSYKLAGVIWNDDGTIANEKPSPLEALKKINEIILPYSEAKQDYLRPRDVCQNEFEIVESALKDNDDMLFEIKALENTIKGLEEQIDEKDKKLKALEIIRTVCPNVFWVMRTYTYEEYKKKCPDDTLLQEEYELLREVLL